MLAASVTIGDLAALADHPYGVYLFYSGGTDSLQYVGKATSRSFIDRIPAHFHPREDAWMNSLPKHIMEHHRCDYEEALQLALGLELTLVGSTKALPGARIEGVLRGYLHPELNSTKRRFDSCMTLAQACEACA